MMPDNDDTEHGAANNTLSEQDDLALKLHLAEYQALMARNTAAMQWAWALVPVGMVFLGLVANAWNLMDHRLLAWGAAAGVQAVIVAAIYLACDHGDNIIYLETDLHKRIATLLRRASAAGPTPLFWGYESFQARRRRNHSVWWEWLQLASVPLLLSAVALTRIPFSLWDWCGLGVNLMVFALLTYKTLDMKRRRIMWCSNEEFRQRVQASET